MEEEGSCKEGRHTLTGVAQLAGHCPTKGNVVGSIPGQGTCLGCGPGPQLGACERQLVDISHIDVSLPPFPSF